MIARLQIGLFAAAVLAISSLTGCNARLPGQPTEAERWRAPAEVTDFHQLYAQNCAGCHGVEGRLGAARSLNDPLYLSFVSDDALRQAISKGRGGTNMPAFSEQAGGHLREQQIETLVTGMRAQWSKPDDFKGVELPRYSVNGTATSSEPSAAILNDSSAKPSQSGDAPRGAPAYQTYCASCHGASGEGGSAGSIVDPKFLNLVSDQGLRTTVVVGRADLGKPDWRSNLPGRPMSSQEIDDVVAWLAAHRQATSVTAKQDSQSSRLSPK
jgi:cytochrome c oxidase cbb3-type subunit 3